MQQRNISRIEKINEIELSELKKRINIATSVILFFVMILVVRLWFLQVLRGPEYVKLSENNRIRGRQINAPRGNILDRKNRTLVVNRPYFNVTWVREDAPNPEEVLKKTAKILKEDINTILARIREGEDYPRYMPIRLKEDIDWMSLVYIENHQYDLPGIRIEVLPSRNYIHQNLGSHLVGYLGSINRKELDKLKMDNYQANDQIGKMGLEKIYEQYLRGEKGKRFVEVDVQGFEQRELTVQEPLPGNDIKLTIDIDLQQVAEEALNDKAAAAVVMEVNSGRVLALASSPAMELEEFIGGISKTAWQSMRENPLNPFLNKSIQGQYPPGSTYKVVTALAGLTEKAVTPETIVYCNGSMMLHGRRYHCWNRRGHGAVNLEKALAESCDIYFYQLGMKLGVDNLALYAQSLGLGTKTGIELEHEKAGLVPTAAWKKKKRKETWQEGETLSLAIGQGFNLTTPLQICQMTATIANGGTRFRPQLIEEVRSSGDDPVHTFTPIIDGQALGNESSLKLIRQGLVEAVNGEHGTGGVAKLENVVVGGKTGTAQVIRLNKYRHVPESEIPYKYRDHAWFTCFAPADNPEIAVTVLVEHGLHGGSGAGPIAKLILQKYFQEKD